MRSPFPGMNPYLENPELWSAVHNRLIVAIADDLVDRISEKYRVEIEKRTYSDVSQAEQSDAMKQAKDKLGFRSLKSSD